ncbi:hypothetical protein HZS_7484 [Henneguya salminicola]|nr:hypothetical protein HZS_7484 [Henneguya salminicola]
MGIAKLCESMSRFAESNKYITTGDHLPSIYKWSLSARLALIPTKQSLAIRLCISTESGMSCRLCGKDVESLVHILNKCKINKPIQILRHDGLISLLINYSFLPSDSVIRLSAWTY